MDTPNTNNQPHDRESQTHFAPAERDQPETIFSLQEQIAAEPHITALLNAIPGVAMILNINRQIVAMNDTGAGLFGGDLKNILGKRPGELVGCIHAVSGPNGCGTDTGCKVCGAVIAILRSQGNLNQQIEECRIRTVNQEYLDWRVTVSPLDFLGQPLQCLVVEDISDHKRRQVLERTFFHDIINTAGALVGFSQMLASESGSKEDLDEVMRLAIELMADVQSQRDLTLAESGDLRTKFEDIDLGVFLKRLAELYQLQPIANGCTIKLEDIGEKVLSTDPRLLKRILSNMIKNALEASGQGDVVTISCRTDEAGVVISVHNAAVMEEHVKLQIFQRSFSTKGGQGRGIGTYSMKLLGEQYLGGAVSFTSEPGAGTTFSIRLPHQPPS
ncbi:MAG: PAS domain-containing sensor histidine kinase [Planctomycetota bacterium]